MSHNNLDSLEVYQSSLAFSNEIWQIVISWNKLAQDTVGKQMIRSADSISANIAEGYGRFHYKDNRNFCYYSRGSILETKGWLAKCKARDLISNDKYEVLYVQLQSIHYKLNAYLKYIGMANKEA